MNELHNIDAERRALCGCILAPEKIGEAKVEARDFCGIQHGNTWEALHALWLDGKPVDLVSLAEELHRRGHLDAAGGPEYVGDLHGYSPSVLTAQPVKSAAIVADLGQRRRLRDQLAELHAEASEPGHTAATFRDRLLSVALEATLDQRSASAMTWADAFIEATRNLDGREGDPANVLPLPWTDLYDALKGLRGGKLYVVAGRPAMGKSIFGCQIAYHAARAGFPAVVYSVEMEAVEITQRIIASESRVPLSRITTCDVQQAEHHRAIQAFGLDSQGWPLTFETGALTIEDVISRSKRYAAQGKCSLIVVDYIQLLRTSSRRRHGNREQEVAEIAGSLKRLAVELGVPVVAMAQLNRELEKRQDKRPMLSDLRESGAIEQDADAVLMLYRPSVYASEGTPQAKDPTLDVLIRKQRGGPTGTVTLNFDGRHTRIRSREGVEE